MVKYNPVLILAGIAILLLFQDIARNRDIALQNAIAAQSASAGTAIPTPTADSATPNAAGSTNTPTEGSTSYIALTDPEDVVVPSYGGRVHISFCEGCAFGSHFKQLKERIHAEFPNMEVVGSNYPVPKTYTYLSYGITVSQVVLGLVPYQFAEQLPPSVKPIVDAVKEKPMMYGMGVYFLGNMLTQKLTSTNAFEVAYDGRIISSRLATGQFPDPNFVVSEIRRMQGYE